MAIQIRKKLTKEQYIKLYSNPVSGIACDTLYVVESNLLQNIRYSKSMILKALNFWFDQLQAYFMRVWYIRHPIIDVSERIIPHLANLGNIMNMIEVLPNSFLFSHRHINGQWGTKDSKGMIIQHQLLADKYPELFKSSSFAGWTTEGKKELYVSIETKIGIKFTVFPCEHPYIEKQKIKKVGITDNGNVYILHPVGKKK